MKSFVKEPIVLAVIPARGGSKGIPRKNLAPLIGQPLLAYSIGHALSSKAIHRTLVSTDSAEIAEVAKMHGADVPFLRPSELAQDDILDLPVFEHVLKYLKDIEGYQPDIVVHLRPTTPFRRIEWIDQAIELLISTPSADSVRSVSRVHQHPYRMFKIAPNGFLDPLLKQEHPDPFLLRRQDLPPIYYYNCVLDVTRRTTVLEQHSMTGSSMLPFEIPDAESIDIDSAQDLAFAEFLIPRMKK